MDREFKSCLARLSQTELHPVFRKYEVETLLDWAKEGNIRDWFADHKDINNQSFAKFEELKKEYDALNSAVSSLGSLGQSKKRYRKSSFDEQDKLLLARQEDLDGMRKNLEEMKDCIDVAVRENTLSPKTEKYHSSTKALKREYTEKMNIFEENDNRLRKFQERFHQKWRQ